MRYHIHSNKHLERLDKPFQVGASLFQYLLQGSIPKFMILAIFRLIPNHIKLSMLVISYRTRYISFSYRSGQMVDSFMVYSSKYDVWALMGAWAVITTIWYLVFYKSLSVYLICKLNMYIILIILKVYIVYPWCERDVLIRFRLYHRYSRENPDFLHCTV